MTRNRWLFMLLLVCSNSFADDVAKIRLVTASSENLPIYQDSARLLSIVFKRINVPYSFEYMPPERASQLFKSGEVDGNVGRVAEYSLVFPQAIRVEPPIFSYQMAAVGVREELHPHSWDELKDYRIAYHRGIKIISVKLAGVSDVEVVSSARDCFLMAKSGRVDFCVSPDTEIASEQKLFADGKLMTFKISEDKAYLFLSPKLSDLSTRISAVLTDMKKTGELEKIFEHN